MMAVYPVPDTLYNLNIAKKKWTNFTVHLMMAVYPVSDTLYNLNIANKMDKFHRTPDDGSISST
jgi:hypothetical protein